MSIKQTRNIYQSFFQEPETPLHHHFSEFSKQQKRKTLQTDCSHNNKLLFPCYNHKRRRAQYFVQLDGSQSIYFCEKCMKMANKMGFRGLNIIEFHGTSIVKNNFSDCRKHDLIQRKSTLNFFLDDVKSVYSRIGDFHDNLKSMSLNLITQCLNDHQIYNIFQRLQNQLKDLRDSFDKYVKQYKKQKMAKYNEVLCRAAWSQQDLQLMIGRLCSNYQKLLVEPSEKFEINLCLMKESLCQKQQCFQKLLKQYQLVISFNSNQIKSVSQQWIERLYQTLGYCFKQERGYLGNDVICWSTSFDDSSVSKRLIQQINTNNTLN